MITETYSTLSSDKLTREDIDRLFSMMDEANKQPHPIKGFINNDGELDEFKKLALAKDIGIKAIYGIPIYVDEQVDKNILRFEMSDGSIINLRIKS